MKRASFTLIELLISAVLTVLIIFFLYGALGSFEKTKELFQSRYEQNDKFNKFYYLLYMDMFYSDPSSISISAPSAGSVTLDEKVASDLSMTTKNSLYGYTNPTVTYSLIKSKNRLIRYETQQEANKSDPSWYYGAEILEFFENVDKFRVFKKDENYLFFVEIEKKPISFEISLAFLKGAGRTKTQDSNETNGFGKGTLSDAPPMPPGMSTPPMPPGMSTPPMPPGMSAPPVPPSVPPLPGRPAGI